MPDLERELAQYGTVLRDRAPAVRVDEVESRLHRPPTSHHPVRAAAAGAVLTLASIGLVFAAGALIDVLGGPLSREAPSAVPAAERTSGPAALAVVAGGGAVAILLGAAVVGFKRRHEEQKPKQLAKTRERRKKKMQTIERPVAPVERLARSNRFLIIGLVLAVLLAAGFGAWLIVDNAQTAVEREITALINSYYQAWEANDGQAVKDLMTEDARLLPPDGGSHSRAQIASLVAGPGGSTYNPTLADGPLIVEPWNAEGWMAAVESLVPDYREASVGQPNVEEHGDALGLELFHIVEQDGRYLINYHEMWRAGE